MEGNSMAKRRSKLQKRILLYLYFTDKPAETSQKIADEVNVYPSSVSRSIKLLKEEGLIEENSSGYQLTDKGKEVIRDSLPQFSQLQQPPIDLSVLKLPEELSSSLKRFQPAIENWNRQMVAIYQTMVQPIQKLQEFYKKAMEPARQLTEWLNKQAYYIAQVTNKALISLKERDEEEAVMLQEINKELIPYGWVFSPSLPAFSMKKIYLQLKGKGVKAVIGTFTEYFTNQVCKQIIKRICSKSEFNTRSHLIRDAFQAHCEEKYTLSVPVFLAQTEGAFMDYFENKLYSSRKKKYLKKSSSSFKLINVAIESFEVFIQDVLAKTYGVKEKIPEGIFARHPILHGGSTDYGMKENSIRAILLLDYVSFIISIQPKNEN